MTHETETAAGDEKAPDRPALGRERRELLEQLEDWLETPMLVLGIAWLALLVLELTRGLSPLLERVGTAIWAVFVLDFGVKLALAPDKRAYLTRNWLTALALLMPAFRVLRFVRAARLLRAARAVRGLRLFRLVSSLNRGMRALRAALGRRGFGYVAALTVAVTLAGAAGMYAFEGALDAGGGQGGEGTEGGEGAARGIGSYGEALWWTAMLMTTMGSEYWPRSAEGRLLCLLLSVYAFAVFGYVTATLATFFIDQDTGQDTSQDTGRDATAASGAAPAQATGQALEALREEVRALREQLRDGGP